MLKTCSKCNLEKELDLFAHYKRSKDGRSYWCKTCHSTYLKHSRLEDKHGHNSRRKQDRETYPERHRNELLKAKYGITSTVYDTMLLDQNESCAVCKRHKTEFSKRLAVDHNHETKRVRGLLCNPCNAAFGLLQENIAVVQSLLEYAIKHEDISMGRMSELAMDLEEQGPSDNELVELRDEKDKEENNSNKEVQSPPKDSCPFKAGDLVTGIDRSYKRSIYKMLSTTEDPRMGLFQYQSLGPDVVERWKDIGESVSQYQMLRGYDEFRYATRKELRESADAKGKLSLAKIAQKTRGNNLILNLYLCKRDEHDRE